MQGLMRALLVRPLQPPINDLPCLLKTLKAVLPDPFFFHTPKEPFNESILLRCIGGDKLLGQGIVSTG